MKKKIALLWLVLVISALILACGKESDTKSSLEIMGNTPGNHVNLSFVARNEEWIFFSNPADAGSLYKMNQEGKKKQKLNSEYVRYLNVLDDWVYYVCSRSDRTIKRTTTDGRITETLSMDESAYLVLYDGWLYYGDFSDGGALCKMKIDGTEKTQLNGDYDVWYQNISGGYIYYTSLDGPPFSKISTEGLNNTSYDFDYTIRSFNVIDDSIYFALRNLFRMNLDGTNIEMIGDENIRPWAINVVGDWIYFNDSRTLNIYKIKTDGSEKTQLTFDNKAYFINIVGDWIYYIDSVPARELNRVKVDGSYQEKIE